MDQNKRFIMIGAVILLLIIIIFVFMSKGKTPVEAVSPPRISSPWQPTTVPYDSECEGECLENIEEIAVIATPHLSGIKIFVRPDVNDAIAQWGDCLDTIMDCIAEKDDASQAAACVAQSQCPDSCKDAYAKQFNAGMSDEQQMSGIDIIFLDDNAFCAPREVEAVE